MQIPGKERLAMIMIAKVLWKVEESIQISLHISSGPVIEKFTCSSQFNKYFSKHQHLGRSYAIEKQG